MMITRRPAWAFSAQNARQTLTKHFGTAGLEGFGFGDGAADAQAIRAAGAVLDYLAETQKARSRTSTGSCPTGPRGRWRSTNRAAAAWRSTRTIRDGRREGSLLWVLDGTKTVMGSRLLAQWVANPLTDAAAIRGRLDAVEELFGDPSLVAELQELLRRVYDLERLLARATTGRASPRDLAFLGRTLQSLPAIKAKLTARQSGRLAELEAAIDLCPELRAMLDRGSGDECPLAAHDGGFIRDGFNANLDALRDLARGGKQWIAQYQAQETQRTGIPTLKVGFNQVFGYYIEITNVHREKIPPEYIRKQTVKNAERYITPELKEYEEKVLKADQQAKELEYRLFLELREAVVADRRRVQATAAALAEIDVLAALAGLARSRNYCRPEIVEEPVLEIVDGRHPVLDAVEPEGKFVPNDPLAAREAGLDSADHRPEHGGQEHLHPPGGVADGDGADRELRAGPAGNDRRGRPHFCPHRRQRRTDPRPEHVHGRDDRDGADREHGDGAEPGGPRRDRPRHEHLRRHFAGLVGCRVAARPDRLPDAFRHALPRADRPGEIAGRGAEPERGRARVAGGGGLSAQDRRRRGRQELRHPRGAAGRPAAAN